MESKRRTAAELDATCEQLCALVRARPGESVVALAEQMGVPATTLQRPMAKLRAEGRVRTVGERHQMRYFPAVTRTATAKG
jgi:DNA-binding IclR family transcriptional regulator